MNFKSRVLSEELLDRGQVKDAKRIFQINNELYFLKHNNSNSYKVGVLDLDTKEVKMYENPWSSYGYLNLARCFIELNNDIFILNSDYTRLYLLKLDKSDSIYTPVYTASSLDIAQDMITVYENNIYLASGKETTQSITANLVRLNKDNSLTVIANIRDCIYAPQFPEQSKGDNMMFTFNNYIYITNTINSLYKLNMKNNAKKTLVSSNVSIIDRAFLDSGIGELNGKYYFSKNYILNKNDSFTQYNYNQNTITGGGIVDNSLLVSVGSDLKFIDKKIYEEI